MRAWSIVKNKQTTWISRVYDFLSEIHVRTSGRSHFTHGVCEVGRTTDAVHTILRVSN
jgi:hypothetical protein